MDSQRNRFFWAMRYIASNGFYVVIDDHLAYDTLVLDDTAKWVASWQQLAAAVPGTPASPGCKTFPVVYGETGSKFDRPLDVQMLDDFAK